MGEASVKLMEQLLVFQGLNLSKHGAWSPCSSSSSCQRQEHELTDIRDLQGYFRTSVDQALDTLRQALGKNPFYKAPEEVIKEL